VGDPGRRGGIVLGMLVGRSRTSPMGMDRESPREGGVVGAEKRVRVTEKGQ
jgi:hypothetical protein